ncbi:MAG: integrase [Geobacteraceae bacterium GWC2_55_20]|nr:MAG: integrase [Geobacteraceae bacterium GWC2_55_20]HCE68372.1 integrase [Geobacter sp.]
MAIIGYARTSTTDQNIEPQIEALQVAGCDRIYQEQRSGIDATRPELLAMLDYCREGDVIVCTKLDRIGRSTADVLGIVEKLQAKRVAFRCLNINLDTSTPTGKMMLTMLAAVATFEREIMLERQREGIAAAKQAGKYTGRKPTAKMQAAAVMELLGQGLTKQAVADRLGIGVASVYRICKAA